MLLVRPATEQATAIEQRFAACWPDIDRSELKKLDGTVLFVRLARGVESAPLAMPFWSFPQLASHSEPVPVPAARDMVFGDGSIFILSRTAPEISRLSLAGEPIKRISLNQQAPVALALTPQGELLVAAPGDPYPLTWYDQAGRVVRTLASADVPYLAEPTSLAVAPGGDIFVADPTLGGVLHLTAEGALVAILTAQGRLLQPAAVALDTAQPTLWVQNGPCAEWVNLSLQDESWTHSRWAWQHPGWRPGWCSGQTICTGQRCRREGASACVGAMGNWRHAGAASASPACWQRTAQTTCS